LITNYDFEHKIRQALEKFRLGYKNRDIKVIDEYIEALFDGNEKTAVLGTSFGEWMQGIEGAKELVQSDWEYWGDVDIDTASARISIIEDVAFVELKGTVRYEFEYTEEKYESYLNFVKNFFDDSKDQSRMSSRAKAGNIGFVLTHFNQNRQEGKREYFYPLRINTVMTIHDDKAVFRFMKFVMDHYNIYPELRIDNQMMNMNEYYKYQNDFVQACAKEQRSEIKEAIEGFKMFIDGGFNGSETISDIQKHFCNRHKPYIIDTFGRIHEDGAAAGFVELQRAMWHNLAIDYKAIFADVKGDAAWMVCNGLASSTISQEKGSEILMSDIHDLMDKNLSSKDKLFVIQKEVANYFFQHSKGECFTWPVRIAAMLVKEVDSWKIHSMSFSYPYYYVLEGKYTV
jgi:hypothetical protein